jgi:hypothetical protein
MRGAALKVIVVVVTVVLGGCQQKQPSSAMGLAAQEASRWSPANTARGDTLAYEHTVAVELSKEVLSERLREIEAACKADSASNCTIIESALRSRERLPSASIRVRLAPAGVEALITLAGRNGRIVERTTQAEDLAQPVADTQRALALLGVHRDRLADIMKRKDLPIDQLITVSKELATVQAQFESANSTHANLRRRIDTDLLTIGLSPPMTDIFSETTPVRDALRESGASFREALAMVIRFISASVPWLVVLLPSLILLRMFWRWLGRWLGRFERRAV